MVFNNSINQNKENLKEYDKQRILTIVKDSDKGKGTTFKQIEEQTNLSPLILTSLLYELMAIGDIFEPETHVYKQL